MKNVFLLPNRCKIWGWIVFAFSALFGAYILFIEESYFYLNFDYMQAFKNNIAIIGPLVGLSLVAFSKESVEDEYVMSLRTDALIKALLIDCLLIIICALFVYGGAYFYYLSFSQYIVLLLYIFIFRYNVYKYLNSNEE